MSAAAQDARLAVTADVARRWQQVDPLLPVPVALAGTALPDGVDHVIVAQDESTVVAIGSCEHWAGSADSLDVTWGAARRFRLDPQIAGPDVASALDRLLAVWRKHLDDLPGTDDPDSAAVVTWPSRDIDGVRILLQRGFAPRGVVAAHVLGGRLVRDAPAAGPDDRGYDPVIAPRARSELGIRRAEPDDIDAVLRLGLETIRFDARFGGVIERPSTEPALRHEVSGMLARQQPWTWLAERDGTAIGTLIADGPESAGWIAPMVRCVPVVYNMLTFVAPAGRGKGVGMALVAQFHATAEAAGAAVSLLHYEQTNPLSAPFWGMAGYRPVWTSWEARPACTVR